MKSILVFLSLTLFAIQGLFAQIAPEKFIRSKGHVIYCLAYSNDGRYLATGGEDKQITIYQTGTWSEIARLDGLKDIPLTIAFSHDGKKVAAGGKDNKVTVWSLATKQIILSLKGHKEQVMSLKFSPNDKYIASASLDKSIIYWDLESGLPAKKFEGHKREVTCLDISPDGDYLVSGGADYTVKIWNIGTGTVKLSIPAHQNIVGAVAFSPDGSIIASGGYDRQIHLWDAVSGQLMNTFLGHKDWIETLTFSPDGNYLLSGGHDKLIILTDLKTGKMAFQSTKQEDYIRALAFSPTGENFTSSDFLSDEFQVWDARKLNIKAMDQQLAQKASKKSGMIPKIELTNLKTGDVVNTASTKITAKIFSESSLRNIQLFVNGQVFASKDRSELMLESGDSDSYTYEETLVLKEGTNTIQIKANNIVGEGLSPSISISYVNAPVSLLSWISPALMDVETNMQSYELKAMINPGPSNQNVDIIVNDVSQGILSFPSNGGILSFNALLNLGVNTVKLRIQTLQYTRETDIKTITYAKADKPLISWVLPATDTSTFISANQIRANIASQIPVDRVEIRVNGLSVYNQPPTSDKQLFLDQQILLTPGVNAITLIAANKAGETISPVRVITYQLPEKTNISWINPSNNTDVFAPSFEIKACIQSKTKVTKVQVFNNGLPILTDNQPVVSPAGECTIALAKIIAIAPGMNQLKITAENMGGVTESDIKTLNYIIPQLAAVKWISPIESLISSSSESTNIKACISSLTPLSAIAILVNNQIITSIPNPLKVEGECAYPLDQTLPLSSGTNLILIKAYNIAGESSSTPLTVEYKTTNPYRFAIIIGNEDYSSYQSDLNSESNVDFALNDARSFKESCIRELGIPEDNIIYLENARYIEMRKALKKINGIIQVTNGKAEVFAYYAGHGFPDEKTKEPYLVPVDGSGSDLEFSAVKLADFYGELTEFPAARITCFIDACFSGGARNQGLVAARGVKVIPKDEKAAVKKNLIVFTASSGDQSSLPYKDEKHGMFTYFLLKKLQDSKGDLTYKALSDYINEQVAIKSFMINSKKQEPQTNISPEIQSEWQNWNFYK